MGFDAFFWYSDEQLLKLLAAFIIYFMHSFKENILLSWI